MDEAHMMPKPLEVCDVCNKQFKSKKNLGKHEKLHNLIKHIYCDYCGAVFASKTEVITNEFFIQTPMISRLLLDLKPYWHSPEILDSAMQSLQLESYDDEDFEGSS